MIATGLGLIGKEANKWEEQHFLGDDDAKIEYGAAPHGVALDERLRRMCEEFGQRKTAEILGVSRSTLIKALKYGFGSLGEKTRAGIARVIN